MRVSYVELFMHCQKVFRACGTPYGCADDGGEVVAWSEFIGLAGMQTLLEEIPQMCMNEMKRIDFIEEKEGLIYFDGNGQSAIILGKLMADYAISLTETRKTVRIHMVNTTRSRLLAQPAYYLATRGKGCLVNYKTASGLSIWILATPDIAYPIFAEGEVADRIMRHTLSVELGQYETQHIASTDFWFVCTIKTELITSCVRNLRQEAKYGSFKLTESAKLKARFDKAYFNGGEVNHEVWNELDKVGRKALVKETESSRLRGAGELTESANKL